MRNFRRPFDDERHDPNCGLKVNQAATPKKCSCCTGALTFQEAGYVKDQVIKISSDSDQDKKERHRVFKKVPWTASQGFENWKDLFGHGNDKESFISMFGVVNGCDNLGNLMFGNSGIMSRTLDYWKEMINKASSSKVCKPSYRKCVPSCRKQTPRRGARRSERQFIF